MKDLMNLPRSKQQMKVTQTPLGQTHDLIVSYIGQAISRQTQTEVVVAPLIKIGP